jgi:hypothetical protein
MGVQTANGDSRFDVDGLLGTAELNTSQYLLTTDTSQLMVDESAHTYRRQTLSIGSIVDMVNAMDAKSVVWMVHIDFDTVGKDTAQGQTTEHYQMKLQYTLEKKDSLGNLAPATTKITADYWVADLPVHFNNPFVGFARPKPGYSPGLKVWMDKMEAAQDVMNKGLIVKARSEGIIGTENPKSSTYIRMMEITGIAQKDIGESVFQIPDGYKLTTGRGRGGG